MKTQKYTTGFTLIETLVAVSILMIAIAGPLTTASKAYGAALEAKHQVVAARLAQESLELLNNFKDNGKNVSNGYNAYVGHNLFYIAKLTNDDACDKDCFVSMNSANGDVTIGKCGADYCPLYYSTDDGYYYGSSGTKSEYRRYISLKSVLGSDDQLRATVYVAWDVSTLGVHIENSVNLSSILTNYAK